MECCCLIDFPWNIWPDSLSDFFFLSFSSSFISFLFLSLYFSLLVFLTCWLDTSAFSCVCIMEWIHSFIPLSHQFWIEKFGMRGRKKDREKERKKDREKERMKDREREKGEISHFFKPFNHYKSFSLIFLSLSSSSFWKFLSHKLMK